MILHRKFQKSTEIYIKIYRCITFSLIKKMFIWFIVIFIKKNTSNNNNNNHNKTRNTFNHN